MPSEKARKKTKEDTWGTEELSKSIKDAMRDDSAKKHRSSDKERRRDGERTKDKEHRKDKDRDRKDKDRKDRHRNEDVNDPDRKRDKDKESRRREGSHREKSDKERRPKEDRERDGDKERRREDKDKRERRQKEDRDRKHQENGESRSHDRDRDREKRHRDDKDRRDKDRHKDRDRSKDRDKDRKHREDRDKDRERRHRDDKDRDKEKRHRDEKDKDRDRRHKDDKDKDKERRHRDDKERDKDRRRDKDKDRDRRSKDEDSDRRRRKDEDRKHRSDNKDAEDEKDSRRHRDRDERNEVHEKVEDVNEEENNAEDDEYGYEDDFEDYEDDFEDDDGDEEDDQSDKDDDQDNSRRGVNRESSAELDEIRRAMASENQAMRSGKKQKDTSSSAGSSRAGTAKSRSFINFVAAKQRTLDQQIMSHTRKRGKELMRLIELDVVAFDLFDMAPVKEYELYIKSFGRSNTKQAFVQYNEDNLDRDIQTDPIESTETWTQHPAEGVAASGGAGKSQDEDGPLNEEDSIKLNRFLKKAGQAISILLEEESSENAKANLQSNQRSIVFSEGYTQLNSQLAFLQGRHVIHAQFHPVQTNLLLTVHSPSKMVDEAGSLPTKGLLCVWNVNEPSRPHKILSCKSTPTCCCFSPTKSTLAFSGTVDGSIIVWDLRELSSMHTTQIHDGQEWTIRVPTFSTDGIQSQENHHSPVIMIQPIVAAEESLKASMQSDNASDNTSGLSFQLASLEEEGIIHFSVVIELEKPDQAGSESDLGLVPCGKIKLIKTSSISLKMGPSRGVGGDIMKTCHMQLSPLDPNQFFVATDSGQILHGARHGGKVPPRIYRDHLEILVEIVQIDFSPFGLPVFLVACADGSIRLYNTMSDLPVIAWSNSTNGMAIKNIQWSRSRPSVFYVMDEVSKVYVWELLENDGGPVKIEQFTHASLTFLTLSSDHPGSGRGQPGKRQEMLITDVQGAMDVHRINQTFSTGRQNELHHVTQLLNKIM